MLCRLTNTDPLMTRFATTFTITFTTIPGTQALQNPQGHHVCSSSGAPLRHEAGIIPQPLLNNTCQCLVLKITNMCWRATTPLSFKHLIMDGPISRKTTSQSEDYILASPRFAESYDVLTRRRLDGITITRHSRERINALMYIAADILHLIILI